MCEFVEPMAIYFVCVIPSINLLNEEKEREKDEIHEINHNKFIRIFENCGCVRFFLLF